MDGYILVQCTFSEKSDGFMDISGHNLGDQAPVLIETGSYEGGSALYFAHIFDLIREGRVVSIDIQDIASGTLSHPRITTIVGSSVSDDVASQVRQIVRNKTAMVSLDSEHSK